MMCLKNLGLLYNQYKQMLSFIGWFQSRDLDTFIMASEFLNQYKFGSDRSNMYQIILLTL